MNKLIAVTITGILTDDKGTRSVSGNWSAGDPLEDLVEARDLLTRYIDQKRGELAVATASSKPIEIPSPS